MIRPLLFVSFVATSFVLVGCTSRDDSAASSKDSPLLSLPETAFGYLHLDPQAPGYIEPKEKLREVLTTSTSSLSALANEAQGTEQLIALLEELEGAGISFAPSELEQAAVAILPGVSAEIPVQALLLMLKRAGSYEAAVPGLAQVLSRHGWRIEPGAQASETKLTSTEGDPPLVISASGRRLAIGIGGQSGTAFLNGQTTTRIEQLHGEDAYTRFKKAAPRLPSRPYLTALLDRRALVTAVGSAPWLTPNSKATVEQLAFDGVYGHLFVDDGYQRGFWVVPTSTRTDTQRLTLQQLQGSPDLALGSSSTGVLHLGLSGSIFQAALKQGGEQIPAEVHDLMSGVQQLTLLIRPPQPGALVPELIVRASSTAPEKLYTFLVARAEELAAQQGLPPGMLQKRATATGGALTSIMTPLGFGAFLLREGPIVALATSEQSAQQAVQGYPNLAPRPTAETKVMSSQPALAVVAFDYKNLATLIEAVQSSLALFTGGQPLLPPDQLQRLKSGGSFAVAIRFNDGVAVFDMVMSPAAPAS